MVDDTLQLTYRELAERLAITPDAARMKAKRAVKSGRWHIIPGNHPADPVRVELPAVDVPPVGQERRKRLTGERTAPIVPRTNDDSAMAALRTAQDQIRALTDQLMAEKDAHRGTSIELAQVETREMVAQAEIERLQSDLAQLQYALAMARRSWWARITGKTD